MLLQQLNDSFSLILIKPSVNNKQVEYFGPVFQQMLIILMLFISGNVHPNPGPANGDAHPIAFNLAFTDFCECKSLGFLHVNIHIVYYLNLIW